MHDSHLATPLARPDVGKKFPIRTYNCKPTHSANLLDLRRKFNFFLTTHVNPAERDEVVLVLHVEQLFLVLRVARVRRAALLRDDEVRDAERVLRLHNENVIQSVTTDVETTSPTGRPFHTRHNCAITAATRDTPRFVCLAYSLQKESVHCFL